MPEEVMEPKTQRHIQEAVDEVERELNVRRRCFPRWVAEGRVSRTDAQDRIDRLATALEVLNGAKDAMARQTSTT